MLYPYKGYLISIWEHLSVVTSPKVGAELCLTSDGQKFAVSFFVEWQNPWGKTLLNFDLISYVPTMQPFFAMSRTYSVVIRLLRGNYILGWDHFGITQ